MTAIPCDNHIRAMLDPVGPRHFDPLFNEALETLERSGGLTAFHRLKGQVLIALDGTEYFGSAKLYCSQCSSRARAGGKKEYFHSLLAARWSLPVTTGSCRCRPSSSSPRTEMTSRTARAGRRAAGLS